MYSQSEQVSLCLELTYHYSSYIILVCRFEHMLFPLMRGRDSCVKIKAAGIAKIW